MLEGANGWSSDWEGRCFLSSLLNSIDEVVGPSNSSVDLYTRNETISMRGTVICTVCHNYSYLV